MTEPTAAANQAIRGQRQTLEGVVVSDKMTKTVMVLVERLVRDPRYGKITRRSARFMAHDASEKCQVGDRVVIVEDRPRSARKRWSVRSVVAKAERA
jgi:small subunit ribosomal protein S17